MFQPTQQIAYPQNHFTVLQAPQTNLDKPYTRTGKDQDWFFFMATKIVSFLGLLCVILSVIWVSTMLFVDNKYRSGYQTTTFLTSTDKYNIDSWQVQAQSWSEISKSNTPADNKFNHYFECWYAAGIVNDRCNNNTINEYKTCVNSKFSTQLTLCANTNNPDYISPSLNTYTQCINNQLKPSRESINGLKVCLRTNIWPLYESPENVDSWYFLGSYNWMTFLSIGFALFSCFVLYTGGFVLYAENPQIDRTTNMPKGNGPLSYSITAVCAGFSLIFFAYFLMNAYRLSNNNAFGSNYPLSNSVATNNVILPATLIVFVYFLTEFLEMWAPYMNTKKDKDLPEQQAMLQSQVMIMTPQGPMLQSHNHLPHTYFNPNKDGKRNQEQQQWYGLMTTYYPALTLAWADAYMLDPIIALGVIGATHQLSTALAYQLFLAIFTYRLAHTSVARLLYAGYITNPDESPSKFNLGGGNNNIVYSIRMQAMFMHLSAAVALVMVWYILTNSNIMLSEFSLIYAMLFLWYLIPEAIRLISHIAVAFKQLGGSDRYVLITCSYIVWIWDVIVRLVFIMIIIWGANTISGTQNFITDRMQNITDTITYMS